MTAPAAQLEADVAGGAFCDQADCASLWRVQLGDGSKWCRLHAAAAAEAYRFYLEVARRRPCSTCGSDTARLYPAGWRCDLHSPAAMRARDEVSS